jgi:hypothetical protein
LYGSAGTEAAIVINFRLGAETGETDSKIKARIIPPVFLILYGIIIALIKK